MDNEKGTISIHTENIFPIIKKFLYSDHEVFLRELVSNAIDATKKLKKITASGQYREEVGDLTIDISFDKKAKTITVSDKGLGMNADEIKKYINQIAFSGASEFLEKFKDEKNPEEIIGKFGLGFYSAFMVADKVELISKSYLEDSPSSRWVCTGSTEFELTAHPKQGRGTDVILHINKDSEEFLEENRLLNILEKYCKFLPIPIKCGTHTKQVEDGVDKDNKPKYKSVTEDRIINNTEPAWTKSPSDLTDAEYLTFYKELYPISEDPLFWIHLNVDYPFNLNGILYFPKIKKTFEVQRNKIQLYSRQVFITDEVKDVVPDFLMLLHGILDSPDIPLNVSRSYLQSDASVKKISRHITKKVADKLIDLFIKDRKNFESKWDNISLFVKYGVISDEKFAEKAREFLFLKNTEGHYFTIAEYLEKIKPHQTNKDKTTILLYTNDPHQQDPFIEAVKNKSYDVLVMNDVIDAHFIDHMERKEEKIQFKRVDSETIDKLIQKDEAITSVLTKKEEENLKSIFEKAINHQHTKVEIESLPPDNLPLILTISEWMRRMKDMSRAGGGEGSPFMMGSMPETYQASVNANHPVIQKIVKATSEEEKLTLAKQSYDLALLSQNRLTGVDLTQFIKRSLDLI